MDVVWTRIVGKGGKTLNGNGGVYNGYESLHCPSQSFLSGTPKLQLTSLASVGVA